jgi:hypothetical protein
VASNVKNAGDIAAAGLLTTLLLALPFVTWTATVPEMASGGVRMLICVGLMK